MIRWLLSGTVRQTVDLCHRVKKILCAQRDVLSSQACEAIEQALRETRATIRSGGDKKAIIARATNLETVANKWLKPYPNASIRENVDVILVALVVAMAVRTFFLQPMAIPTGSMQPTLFGMMPNTPKYEATLQIPNFFVRVYESLVHGASYYHVQAAEEGTFVRLDAAKMVFPFVKKQDLVVESANGSQRRYPVWFPPEDLSRPLTLRPGERVQAGDDLLKVKITSGDRLFVDRVTYNFRRPERGDIVIFQTHGISGIEQDTHYIKRLVALGGEHVRIGDDRHIVINGNRLDASTPHFENVYGFDPKGTAHENQYSGHVNEAVGARAGRMGLARLFPDAKTEFILPPNHCLTFGDNTMNSLDSRSWGYFPQGRIVGKCFFVFWPISERFGWGVR